MTEPVEEGSAGRFVETLLAAVAQFDDDVRGAAPSVAVMVRCARHAQRTLLVYGAMFSLGTGPEHAAS